jgi:hypothetical protein
MKTFSVKQPWSYLICSGIKDVENRSWKTNFRGRILIHSSKKISDSYINIEQQEYIATNHKKLNPIESHYIFSAIIGSVELVDCVKNSKSIWAEEGSYHWILKNPILFETPIENIKGKLSLWEYNL